jgi:hypothetical protein
VQLAAVTAAGCGPWWCIEVENGRGPFLECRRHGYRAPDGGLDEALTVAWDGVAKRLLVGTGGSTNQILIVDVAGAEPKVVGTFGEKGA